MSGVFETSEPGPPCFCGRLMTLRAVTGIGAPQAVAGFHTLGGAGGNTLCLPIPSCDCPSTPLLPVGTLAAFRARHLAAFREMQRRQGVVEMDDYRDEPVAANDPDDIPAWA